MATKQRAVDRGSTRGRLILRTVGGELRLARAGRGLSLEAVANEVGISRAELSRIERADAEWASVLVLARLCAVVGLDLAARAYQGGSPIRDARHARILEELRRLLHASLAWAIEVPFPNPGDQRAWDALIRGEGWRFGVEAELNPIDGQALIRRVNQKQKEGMVDGLILLMPDTRQTRAFRREFAEPLKQLFPIPARAALQRLAVGQRPGGNAMIVL